MPWSRTLNHHDSVGELIENGKLLYYLILLYFEMLLTEASIVIVAGTYISRPEPNSKPRCSTSGRKSSQKTFMINIGEQPKGLERHILVRYLVTINFM